MLLYNKAVQRCVNRENCVNTEPHRYSVIRQSILRSVYKIRRVQLLKQRDMKMLGCRFSQGTRQIVTQFNREPEIRSILHHDS